MDMVFQKTADLAEALLASDAWKALSEAEEAFRGDEEAKRLTDVVQSRRQGIARLQQIPDPDPMALKQLSDAADEAASELESLETTIRLRQAQLSFNQLIEQVNQVLQFIVTGKTETRGCGGNCSGCSGCH